MPWQPVLILFMLSLSAVCGITVAIRELFGMRWERHVMARRVKR